MSLDQGIKLLCSAAIQPSSNENYQKALAPYFDFCAGNDADPLTATPRHAAGFIWYLYDKTTVKHGQATKAMTALVHFWACNGINFERRQFPVLSKMLKGYHILKPSDTRPKKPFSYWHLLKLIPFIDRNTFYGWMIWMAVDAHHFFGGRIGECLVNSREDWPKVLSRGDIQKVGRRRRTTGLILNFGKHKTNKYGLYNAKVSVKCTCSETETDPLCPVHIALQYLKLRDREYGTDPSYPLIMNLKGMPMTQYHFRNFMKRAALYLGLDPNDYSPHSCRSGRCTDLRRANKPDWAIKIWGRWRSDCWKDYYLKLDMSDMAKISHLSYDDLGIQDSHIPRQQALTIAANNSLNNRR